MLPLKGVNLLRFAMNTKNNKVSFILIDDLNHAVKDNEPDEHFQFVQNLAKNFDKSRFIKTDYKRSSSGVDVSTSSCCSNSSCISLNNRCEEAIGLQYIHWTSIQFIQVRVSICLHHHHHVKISS